MIAKIGFIVGHYKSGSTWLCNMLSLHPGIRGVYETHSFRYAHENLRTASDRLFEHSAWGGLRSGWMKWKLAELSRSARVHFGLATGQATLSALERPTTRHDLSIVSQRHLRQVLGGSETADEFCRLFFDFLLEEFAPTNYLIEKTPTNIDWVPTIKKLFPTAKLIAVYRDGRDVVQSELFQKLRVGREVGTFTNRIKKWKAAMNAQIEFEQSHQLLCVSFEETRRDPRGSLLKVMKHLDLSPDEDVLEDMLERSSFEFVTGRKRDEEDRNSFYRKGSAGEWIRQFSDEQKREFSEIAGQTLVDLGYECNASYVDWKSADSPHNAL